MATVVLPVLSHVFVNCAWHGRLKFKDDPLWQAVAASWGIALEP